MNDGKVYLVDLSYEGATDWREYAGCLRLIPDGWGVGPKDAPRQAGPRAGHALLRVDHGLLRVRSARAHGRGAPYLGSHLGT